MCILKGMALAQCFESVLNEIQKNRCLAVFRNMITRSPDELRGDLWSVAMLQLSPLSKSPQQIHSVEQKWCEIDQNKCYVNVRGITYGLMNV